MSNLNEQFKEAICADVREAINKLSAAVIHYGRNKIFAKAIFEEITREHRTLQQSMSQVIFDSIRLYSDYSRTDLRNEEAVKVCKSIKAYMEEYTDEFWVVISWIAL